ncbi:hypothetical protein [Paenibacillus sp. sgz500992]|uniref:hypothetical protein n=1 Tax=Paenibacillus sp. sgz500992 TaxID=3242476 RepID=UPI0036D2AA5B
MYIQYIIDQLCLPMDLEEDILPHHLVRVVNAVVNRLDDSIEGCRKSGSGRQFGAAALQGTGSTNPASNGRSAALLFFYGHF